MSGKHTPGPWLFRLEAVRTVIFHEGVIGERAIAVGAGWYPDHIANARLIAAAPELLAACIAFMPKGMAIGNGNVPDDLIIPMDVTMGELRAFEAAIAKATGA